MENKTTKVIKESDLEKVKEEMCDKFCQYPYELDESELYDKCENCPLNRL